jgi:hypothetical protein
LNTHNFDIKLFGLQTIIKDKESNQNSGREPVINNCLVQNSCTNSSFIMCLFNNNCSPAYGYRIIVKDGSGISWCYPSISMEKFRKATGNANQDRWT